MAETFTRRRAASTLETFAKAHRVRVVKDECGDDIIRGRRAHLYFDGPQLCLMAIDQTPILRRRWVTLGGHLWLGDISPDATGNRVQDVRVVGITDAKAALRIAGVKRFKVTSEKQRLALANGAVPFVKASLRPVEKGHLSALESIAGHQLVVQTPHTGRGA